MSSNLKKLITVAVLLTFIAVGAFGFMFMMHTDSSAMAESCPIGTAAADCPVSIFAHLDAWRGITFNFAQIFLVLASVSVLYVALHKRISHFRILLTHKIREKFSEKVSELQLLYSILFSDGIIQAKITPHIQY